MKTLEEMQRDGIDINSAMERFLNNEEMYRSFLRRLPDENTYDNMLEAVRKKEVSYAFDEAHKLKGILGNLALTEAYNKLFDIVECLRRGELPEDSELSGFISVYEKWITYIKDV